MTTNAELKKKIRTLEGRVTKQQKKLQFFVEGVEKSLIDLQIMINRDWKKYKKHIDDLHFKRGK